MVGDGTWLTVTEASKRLGFASDRVRYLADNGYLRSIRPPRTGGPGYRHRRIQATSVSELIAILTMPEGADQDTALEALRIRNRGGSPS